MPTGPRPEPPTRCVKVVFSGAFGGQPWVNVMWLFFTGSGEITSSTLSTIAGALLNQYAQRFAPLLSDQWSVKTCQLVLYDNSGDDIDVTVTSVTAGAQNLTTLPANVAACISWHIAPHYRGGHPRTYIAGLGTGLVTGTKSLAATFQSSLASAANQFHTNVEGLTGYSGVTSIEHGIVSFVRSKAWRSPPVFYRITNASVDSRIDSQRRRLGRDVP